MKDPFDTLGIPSSAGEEEIKAAYRRLAKQYHPDLHPGDTTAEAKMREINEAYTEAIRVRKNGSYRPENYGTHASGYGGPEGARGGGEYGRQQAQWDPFGFGGPFGHGGQQQRTYRASASHYDDPELQTANEFILQGRYQEALNLLNRMTSHGASWNYLCALANLGMGNQVAALNHSRQAVNLDPANTAYQELLNQLQNTGNGYRSRGGTGGIGDLICAQPWLPLVCCLCGSRFMPFVFCC